MKAIMDFIGFLIVVVGVFCLGFSSVHLLMILLSLEYMSLGVFILLTEALGVDNIYLPLVFLIFIVCEGAIGLSLLVTMSRSYGMISVTGMQWGYN